MIDKSASQNAWKDLTELTILSTDRVSVFFCPEAGHCKSAIRRSFPDVFGLFGPFKVGKIYPPKKFRFQRWLKLTYFLIYEFWGLPTLECQFEQILEYNLFWGWDFWTFFHSYGPKIPIWNFTHLYWSKQAKYSTRKTPKNGWFIDPCFRTRQTWDPIDDASFIDEYPEQDCRLKVSSLNNMIS